VRPRPSHSPNLQYRKRIRGQTHQKTAWVGAFLIITWYWVSILGLYIVDGFTIALMPSLDSLSDAMLNFLEVSLSNPGLSLVFALIGGLSMWALEALYYIREVLLYVFVYGMPIGFALAWKHPRPLRYRNGVQ